MKFYSCIVRYTDDGKYYQSNILYYSNNSGDALEYIMEHYLGFTDVDKGVEIKIKPARFQAKSDDKIIMHDFDGRIEITKEEYERGFGDNDIFLGDDYDELMYDGDCVFISSHGTINNEKIDTTENEKFIEYCENHPVKP